MDGPKYTGGLDTLDDFVAHFGVKGMKWGHRKTDGGVSTAPPASDDAQRASAARTKAKMGGTKALSNDELRDLVNRMNLEQQFNRLQPPSGSKAATKFVTDTLVSIGKQELTKAAAGFAAKQVAQLLKK